MHGLIIIYTIFIDNLKCCIREWHCDKATKESHLCGKFMVFKEIEYVKFEFDWKVSYSISHLVHSLTHSLSPSCMLCTMFNVFSIFVDNETSILRVSYWIGTCLFSFRFIWLCEVLFLTFPAPIYFTSFTKYALKCICCDLWIDNSFFGYVSGVLQSISKNFKISLYDKKRFGKFYLNSTIDCIFVASCLLFFIYGFLPFPCLCSKEMKEL